ncbi:hypothetical protein [Metamycoplasma equirhinis]|uniref:hypothetical protein n=1 Tax=Metamycoplasma equirhinis TaxID=92402 RepID=UPI00359C5AD6
MKKKLKFTFLLLSSSALVSTGAFLSAACVNPFKATKPAQRLNSTQLKQIHDEVVFKRAKNSEASNKELGEKITELTTKYKRSLDIGNDIRHDSEFKKYFYLKIPNMSNYDRGAHKFKFWFEVNNETGLVELHYDIICSDFPDNPEAINKIIKIDN